MATTEIRTKRLVLTPLRVADAAEMVEVLADAALNEFIGGAPPTLDGLTALYRSQVAGPSGGDEIWHNWIVRLLDGDSGVGFVQATVEGDSADLAWVVGAPWQGRGYASEAAMAMRAWLSDTGTQRFEAHIHPEHAASQRVALAIGLVATGEIDDDDEEVWTLAESSG
ncbi:MAG: GNAT family N-acetyltransferase [bacterium]|nr:GNAT family N-acetyltransferase [bacterium]